jgi:hypothetical protein
MVTMVEHHKFVKKIKSTSTTENKTFAELNIDQGKVKKVQGQLDKYLEKIKEICFVYSDIVYCRAPAINYTFFLLKHYLFLRINAIRAEKPFEFTIFSEFVSCFRE